MGNSIQLQTLSPIPDLSVPVNYENWRTEQFSKGATRAELSGQLERHGSEYALVRATQVISVEPAHQDVALRLTSRLMCADDPLTRLFGRYQTAYLVMRGGYQNDPESPITAQTVIPTLLEVLAQLLVLPQRNLLSLELELRIHVTLSETYTISEDWELAYTHAAKAATLAPSVGLLTLHFSAKSLVATALFYKGHSAPAVKMYLELHSDPAFESLKSHTTINLSLALFWSGDFIGATLVLRDYLSNETTQPESELNQCAKCVRAMTLEESLVDIRFDIVPNRLSMLTQAHLLWQQACSVSPFSDERRNLYREAKAKIAQAVYNSDSWAATHERAFSALCSMKAGDYGVAVRCLPKLDNTMPEPLWVRLFSLFVTLEVAIRSPHQAGKSQLYSATVPAIQELLQKTDTHIIPKLVKRLQLLTPWALAFIAALGGVDESVVTAGFESIVNVNTRPATVYGTAGIRPIQIAQLTLEAFGIPQFADSRIGGGQLEALTACLYRPFGACKYWFEPVLPARLIVALLEAATSTSLSESLRDACKQSAGDISRTFGIVPRLQKTAIPDVLLVLEHEMTRALYGDLDLSLIWHTVEVYQGGKI